MRRICQYIDRLLLQFAVVIAIVGIIPAYGQDFPMQHFGVEDGLPSNRVYEVYRDSEGFLWMATDKGVARYNGVKFERFTTSDGLADNDIFFFQEDKQGRLWFGSYNGKLSYYKDGIIHNPDNTPFLRVNIKSYFTSFIKVQYDSTVTIGFGGQSFFINIKDEKCTILDLANEHNIKYLANVKLKEFVEKYFFSHIHRIVKNRDGTYDVPCLFSWYRINAKAEIIQTKTYSADFYIQRDFGQNRSYFYNQYGLYSENLDTIRSFTNGTYDKVLYSFIVHRFYLSEYFFVATHIGLYVNDSLMLLRSKAVSCVTQDNTGNYWISTLKDGIYCLDKDFINTDFNHNAYTTPVLYSDYIKGYVFFATVNNSLYGIHSKKVSQLFDFSRHHKQREDVFNVPIYDTEPGLMVDSNFDYYYLYHNNSGVIKNIFNPDAKKAEYYTKILSANIKAIYRAFGYTYIHSGFMLSKLDYKNIRQEDTLDRYIVDINRKRKNNRIFGSAQSPDGNIWYSVIDSVYKITRDSSYVQPQLSGFTLRSFVLCGKYMIAMALDNKIYLCSNYDGNAAIDSLEGQNCIWDKLYKIDSEHVLIGTNSRYRLLTLLPSSGKPKFKMMVIENPIVPLQAESICSDGDYCYFFKNGSITKVAVSTLLRTAAAPILSFTFLKMKGKKMPVNQVSAIPFDKAKNLTLSYSTISFSGKDVSYQYSISKDDKDNWNNINAEEINLINPNYGDYTIKVRAKTLSSNYSPPIVFTLHIEKPFWATWWFISLSVLAAGGVIALVVWQRIKAVVSRREKTHDDKVRFMRSEYIALNALMNPHFIFNTLNNVQSLVNGNNKLAANEYLRIFSDLVRQNMHNVSKELIPLQKEVDLVTNYLLLEKLRFEDKLNYEIEIDPDLELYDIMVSPLLIQPLVENSIKHGILPLKDRVGIIKISIEEKNSVLYIKIRDNGVGLNNAKAEAGSLHESYGLGNIKKRIEHLSIIQGKEMTFDMGEETDAESMRWTTVTITMQLD